MVCDHTCVPVPALINCAVIRTELPDLRTEPSSTLATCSARDLRDCDFLPFERERRRARRHLQLRNLREQIEHFLGDAVGKVFLVLRLAHVDERQHSDGIVARRRCRGRSRRVDALGTAGVCASRDAAAGSTLRGTNRSNANNPIASTSRPMVM